MSKLATLAPEQSHSDSPALWQEAVRYRPATAMLLAGGVTAIAALLWSYWEIVEWLLENWSRNPDYSHGYLVPVFSVALLWFRRDLWPAHGISPTPSAFVGGAGLILLGGLARAAGIYVQIITLEALSIIPCIAGIGLCVAGWPAVRVAWPAVAFLFFMVPIPGAISGIMSSQLQKIATIASTFTLQLGGLPAVAEGNIIWLSETRIGVAEACSGLRMLVSFTALACAACLLIRRPVWEKIVILLSVPVLAIVANVTRIVATGAAYEFGSAALADKIFHDLAGWLMMPLGLGMLLIELAILSRIFLPEAKAELARSAAVRSAPATRRVETRSVRRDTPHRPRRRSR